ncbi:MAG: NAD(P)/FAD-dependent oxidoreductase [Candidatus Odinarchaeota archaeon]
MATAENFDVIIIGAGPAGIFTALELIEKTRDMNGTGVDIKIGIFEKGKILDKRKCYRSENGCKHCKTCSIMCGWGGSGAFSDGKLTLSTEIGGWLEDYVGNERLAKLMEKVKNYWIRFGASEKRILDLEKNASEIAEYRRKALLKGIDLIPFKVMHIGTDGSIAILKAMYEHLTENGIQIFFNTPIENVLVTEEGKVKGIVTGDNREYRAEYVVAATGREGADWLREKASNLGLRLVNNPVDIGVRVELPAELSQQLTDLLYEFKCRFYSPTFDQLVRTFCVCPKGEVTMENTSGGGVGDRIITVNGHSYAEEEKQTKNTNFAILVTSEFTEPFKDPIAFGKSIAKLANLLSDDSVIIQRLVDLKKGRRSTPARLLRTNTLPTLQGAVPGDLSFVLPYRHLKSILEFIEALDETIIPGVNSNHTLLYGVEAKFYSSRIDLTKELETAIKGLYAIGDGSGVTRSLSQASASGMIVGETIAKNLIQKK